MWDNRYDKKKELKKEEGIMEEERETKSRSYIIE